MLSKNDELFLTVAKSESISKAAEQLYISQPSLTKRMQQLEAQLGVALFDHKSRPLKLSPAGELYYEYLTRSAVQEHALLLLRQYMHNTEIAVTMRLSTILKTIKQPL